MRKRIVGDTTAAVEPELAGPWLDLDALAQVEVSSEQPGFGIENALVPGSAAGWKAGSLGAARITLRFDTPQTITRTLLHFTEAAHERSQEWALTATFADGSERELLRQGWNFSPEGSGEQQEVYVLQLQKVTALLLWIDPDRGRDRYPATLAAWRLG